MLYGVPSMYARGIRARAGYRAKVLEQKPSFYDCGTTKDVGKMKTPFIMVSPGYPESNVNVTDCALTATAESGIRVSIYTFAPGLGGYLKLLGKDTAGNPLNETYDHSYLGNRVPSRYLLQNVTITISISTDVTQAQYGFYIIAVEPYDISAKMACDQYDNEATDSELQIWTPGYSYLTPNIKPYYNNIECDYKITVTKNYQMILETLGMSLERDADFFVAPGFNISYQNGVTMTGYNAYHVDFAPIGLRETNLKLTTDGLGTSSGGIMNVLLADCECTGGVFNLQNGSTTPLPFAMPPRHHDEFQYNTYCRQQTCTWTFLVDKGAANTVNFTDVDVVSMDKPQIFSDGKVQAIDRWGVYGFTNVTNITVQFVTFASGTYQQQDIRRRGIKFEVKSVPIVPLYIDICNTSIYEINQAQTRAVEQEYIFTSCNGPLAIALYQYEDEQTVEIYDGTFETGTKMKLANQMIFKQLTVSVRIKNPGDFGTQALMFISDHFLAPDGKFCGGRAYEDLPCKVEGCLYVAVRELSRIQIDWQPIPTYRGASIQPEDLVPYSTDYPLDLYTPDLKALTFTFRIPANYLGTSQYEANDASNFVSPGSTPMVIVSSDWLEPNLPKKDLSVEVFCNEGTELPKLTLLQKLEGTATVCTTQGTCLNATDGLGSMSFNCDQMLLYQPGTATVPFVAELHSEPLGTSTTSRPALQ
ncbi:unnamed protein product, partial [Mesorhabditis spiculigera]